MKRETTIATISTIIVASIFGFVVAYETGNIPLSQTQPDLKMDGDAELQTFASEDEFQRYISEAETSGASGVIDEASGTEELDAEAYEERAIEEDMDSTEGSEIDQDSVVEPERLVYDEDAIYQSQGWPDHLHAVDNLPEMELKHNESGLGGDLVLEDEYLLAIDSEGIELLDRESLESEWSKEVDSRIQTVRKSGGELILLTRENIHSSSPCPIYPMEDVEVACSNVIYPSGVYESDYTYHLTRLDVDTGDELDSTGFVGSRDTEILVGDESTFIGYTDSPQESEIIMEFLLNEASVDSEFRERIEEIQSYDLTEISIQNEVEDAMNEFEGRNGEDEMETVMEEFVNWDEENMRDYHTTHLVEFDNEGLEEANSLEFEGKISSIETIQNQLMVEMDIDGLEFENSETDLHLVEDGEVSASEESLTDNIRSIDEFEDKFIVETSEELQLRELESLEIEETIDQDFRTSMVSENYLFLTESVGEDRAYSLKAFDGEFQEVDSFRFESFVYGLENRHVQRGEEDIFVTGWRSSEELDFLVFDGGFEEVEADIESSGQLLSIEDHVYLASSDLIQSFDEDFDLVSEIELVTPTPDRPTVRPEPVE